MLEHCLIARPVLVALLPLRQPLRIEVVEGRQRLIQLADLILERLQLGQDFLQLLLKLRLLLEVLGQDLGAAARVLELVDLGGQRLALLGQSGLGGQLRLQVLKVRLYLGLIGLDLRQICLEIGKAVPLALGGAGLLQLALQVGEVALEFRRRGLHRLVLQNVVHALEHLFGGGLGLVQQREGGAVLGLVEGCLYGGPLRR